MTELTSETVALLNYLLPGLLAAWVFYGMTSHVKPQHFERIVQALIFTFLIQASIPLIRALVESLDHEFALNVWPKSYDHIAAFVVAMVFGIGFAHLTNRDIFHRFLRKCGVSTKTSHPSEWYGVLSEGARYVTLHLKDERMLHGYPQVWPSDPEKGHFYVMHPHWLIDKNGSPEYVRIKDIDGLLIDVKEVTWVEIFPFPTAQGGHADA